MNNYKGLFTFDVDNHRYLPIEQADGLISDMFYNPEPKEEPKDFWYIEPNGVVARIDEWDCCTNSDIEIMKTLGNYFKTKEEAEKAVEKLKALRRLKDKGFRFELWDYDGGNYQERIRTGRILFRVKDYEEIDELLDLLFGGEE